MQDITNNTASESPGATGGSIVFKVSISVSAVSSYAGAGFSASDSLPLYFLAPASAHPASAETIAAVAIRPARSLLTFELIRITSDASCIPYIQTDSGSCCSLTFRRYQYAGQETLYVRTEFIGHRILRRVAAAFH